MVYIVIVILNILDFFGNILFVKIGKSVVYEKFVVIINNDVINICWFFICNLK